MPLSRADARFAELVPRGFARRHLVVGEGPSADGAAERVAAAARTPPAALHNLATRLGRRLEVRIADEEEVARAVDALYEEHGRSRASGGGPGAAAPPGPRESVDALLARADRDLLNLQGKGEVVLLVDALLFEALGAGASDVHVQPAARGTVVRYRVDGVLRDARTLEDGVALAVASRVKVMGRMDIAERRAPQDGRATVSVGGREVDLRISTVPTSHGERVVLRILDRSRRRADFASLGMPPETAASFLARARMPNGIILVTGPTGSGKTTTLYATIREVATAAVNAMTIEDPIEYELSEEGIQASQAQVNPRKGITFATGLRHILRQDPDIVMVGEIRDAETARMAIQASLTGHLVLSTLHTNDAPGAVTRLVDLGVEPCLVSATLSAVLAQRLVRLAHGGCGGAGCAQCLGTGFLGRTGVYELLVADEAIRRLVHGGGDAAAVRAAARARGMRTLAEEGVRLAEAGATTREEVERVLAGID